MFTKNELLARFTIKWMDAENLAVMPNVSDSVLDSLTDQAVADFEVFCMTCDNTSKETQLESIEKYFKKVN
jgi:hypothetical protein